MQNSTYTIVDELQQWHKEYIQHISSLSYAKNTILLYERVGNQFIEYFIEKDSEMNLSNIKSKDITGFLAYCKKIAIKTKKIEKNTSLSKSTKETYIKGLKGLFSFISGNNDELISYDRLWDNIKIAGDSKLQDKMVYLEEKEVKKLLDYLEKSKNKNKNNAYRNALFVKLLLLAGLRTSEALGVKISDFILTDDNYQIKIIGKGEKMQFAYILKSDIEDELIFFKNTLDNDVPIMTVKNNKLWNRSNAYQVVNNIYKKVGIQKKGLHLLRHTTAMRLTNKGMPITTVKKILRHSNISTTTIYSKATKENVINALKSVNGEVHD